MDAVMAWQHDQITSTRHKHWQGCLLALSFAISSRIGAMKFDSLSWGLSARNPP